MNAITDLRRNKTLVRHLPLNEYVLKFKVRGPSAIVFSLFQAFDLLYPSELDMAVQDKRGSSEHWTRRRGAWWRWSCLCSLSSCVDRHGPTWAAFVTKSA